MSRLATVGLGLSLSVLIVTLSVMNGFEKDIRDALFLKTPHIIALHTHQIDSYPPEIVFSDKYYQLRVLLPQSFFQQALVLISSRWENRLVSTSLFYKKDIPASLEVLSVGAHYQMRPLLLNDIHSFQDYQPVLLLPIQDAEIFDKKNLITTQGFWVKNPFEVDRVLSDLQVLYPHVKFLTWSEQYQQFFDAMMSEKILLSIVLSFLIVLIYGQFALTLILIFNDKKEDMNTLRHYSFSSFCACKTLFYYGLYNVCIGVILGLFGGVTFSLILPDSVAVVEKILGYRFLPQRRFFEYSLPTEISAQDLVWTSGLTFVFGVFVSYLLAQYAFYNTQKDIRGS